MSKVRLKRLSDQVVVITGATSGIGLATARMAARAGARLVLAARNEPALFRLADEVNGAGGEAIHVVADVGREADQEKIASAAIARFGGFDTWVNNAGVGLFGKLEEVTTADHRRLFETNFWGVVYGSLAAVRHLRKAGGTLINVGSVLSDRAIPLQGMYSASKHAVKGYTEALRMELEKDGAPVNVSLVKPSGIDTPYTEHAKNYMEEEPSLPPPVYTPDTVAKAILHCATHPTRDVVVGGGGRAILFTNTLSPRLMDKMMEATMFREQKKGEPRRRQRGEGLWRGASHLRERGDHDGMVLKHSAYTGAATRPWLTLGLLAGAGVAAAWLLRDRMSLPRGVEIARESPLTEVARTGDVIRDDEPAYYFS